MTAFDPGEGWREVQPSEAIESREYLKHNTADTVQVWVREEPVPALPTDPYTIIRVTWGDDGPTWPSEFVLLEGAWFPLDTFLDAGGYVGPGYDLDPIKSFVVLAEPASVAANWRRQLQEQVNSEESNNTVVRRETTKAVLDEIRTRMSRALVYEWPQVVDAIINEFGVES